LAASPAWLAQFSATPIPCSAISASSACSRGPPPEPGPPTRTSWPCGEITTSPSCSRLGRSTRSCSEDQQLANHTQSGLPENIAALLSYVLGWITGLIFLLIDKRPFVRFHAAQSIVVFVGLHILRAVLGVIFGFGWWYGGFGLTSVGALLLDVISLISLALWIVLMVKAYQGVRFKLPVVGDIAESFAR
jgi:uncharacterized membrane protein